METVKFVLFVSTLDVSWIMAQYSFHEHSQKSHYLCSPPKTTKFFFDHQIVVQVFLSFPL